MGKKNLFELYLVCKQELLDLGIHVGEVRSIKAKKMRNRWGACKYKQDFVFTYFFIEINERLLDDDVPIESLKSTIMHELLHTVLGCQDHGAEFKRLAEKVNSTYGYKVAVRSNETDKGSVVCNDTPKYLFKCEECGQLVRRYRKSAFTENPDKFKCAICGGKFKRLEVAL